MDRHYPLRLNFLLYPSEDQPGHIVAHCLELDVVAAASTHDDAILLLKELIGELLEAAEKDGTLDQVMNPAPAKYWRMLAGAREYVAPSKVRKRHIAPVPLSLEDVGYAIA